MIHMYMHITQYEALQWNRIYMQCTLHPEVQRRGIRFMRERKELESAII